MPAIAGIHHVALSVTDLERSVAWYSDLLGMVVAFEADGDDFKLKVLADPSSGTILGLRQHLDGPGGDSDDATTGMDHFAFGVGSLDELKAWEGELEKRGIPFTPAVEMPIGTVVVFRDPDNVQVEFWLPAG